MEVINNINKREKKKKIDTPLPSSDEEESEPDLFAENSDYL